MLNSPTGEGFTVRIPQKLRDRIEEGGKSKFNLDPEKRGVLAKFVMYFAAYGVLRWEEEQRAKKDK